MLNWPAIIAWGLALRTEINGKWFYHEILGAAIGLPKPWRLNGTRLLKAAAQLQNH